MNRPQKGDFCEMDGYDYKVISVHSKYIGSDDETAPPSDRLVLLEDIETGNRSYMDEVHLIAKTT